MIAAGHYDRLEVFATLRIIFHRDNSCLSSPQHLNAFSIIVCVHELDRI